ncbi:MAG: hypothetical protein AABX51_08540, partial [Nanoarchaeota archaeon]
MKLKIFLFLVLFLGIVGSVHAETGCCSQSSNGLVCQNVERAQCTGMFAPSKCDDTSFCKKGTCYDANEGICMENTPISACNAAGGQFYQKTSAQIAECRQGCCILGEQTQFITAQRCSKLSSVIKRTMNFRDDIATEAECSVSTQGSEMGACTYEENLVKSCKFTTGTECSASNEEEQNSETTTTNATTNVSVAKKLYTFNAGYLCS